MVSNKKNWKETEISPPSSRIHGLKVIFLKNDLDRRVLVHYSGRVALTGVCILVFTSRAAIWSWIGLR